MCCEKTLIKLYIRNFRVHINNIKAPHGNTNRPVQSQSLFTRTQKIKYLNYTFVVINTWSGYNSKKCPCIYTSEGISKLHSTRYIIDFIIFSFQGSRILLIIQINARHWKCQKILCFYSGG